MSKRARTSRGIKTRKICVVTGARSDYGLLEKLILLLHQDQSVELQLIVTGSHLSNAHGMTIDEIEGQFNVTRSVELVLASDSPSSVCSSMGLGLIKFGDLYSELGPELLLVLGDRFEIFAATLAAVISKVPVGHIHGGETTEGAVDEAFRHSISKMASIHFAATEQYRRRIIQLGEDPDSVFNVGGLGVDAINGVEILRLEQLETELQFEFRTRNFLITYHPLTIEPCKTLSEINSLLEVLDMFHDVGLIFTLPNADDGNAKLIALIKNFCSERNNAIWFASLGQVKYFSCLSVIDVVIGNSSSGLLEVPSFSRPTLNIGDRQAGRVRALSVIDVDGTVESIQRGLKIALSKEFKALCETVVNPYGKGGASNSIYEIIKRLEFPIERKKKFFDINFDVEAR